MKQSWFFEKKTGVDKPLVKLTKEGGQDDSLGKGPSTKPGDMSLIP